MFNCKRRTNLLIDTPGPTVTTVGGQVHIVKTNIPGSSHITFDFDCSGAYTNKEGAFTYVNRAVQREVNGGQFDSGCSSARTPRWGVRVDELTKSRRSSNEQV